jgi:hypothetical protein
MDLAERHVEERGAKGERCQGADHSHDHLAQRRTHDDVGHRRRRRQHGIERTLELGLSDGARQRADHRIE